MPIYEFAETGEIMKPKRDRVVHLGYGDVIVALPDTLEKGAEIMFLLDGEEHPIGDLCAQANDKTTGDYPGCVRIAFDKVESLDVLIERATTLRAEMVARQESPEP